jgi:Spy/CpxP family protein refolding chaperone
VQKKIIFGVVLVLVLAIGIAIGYGVATQTPATHTTASKSPPTPSAYGELLDTEIRGIDSETIEGYLTGAGIGLALPAELNGYPGPRHVLDLANELALTPEQETQIQALFDSMQPQAIDLGQQILAKEAQLEQAFRENEIDEDYLKATLAETGELKVQLRFVHLRTHLATIEILSKHQVVQYNSLRGYSDMPQDHNHDGNHS